jgi:hypothetical protein
MMIDIEAPVTPETMIDTGATATLTNMRDLDTGARVMRLAARSDPLTKAPITALDTRRGPSIGAPTSVLVAKNVLAIGAPDMNETRVMILIAVGCCRHTVHRKDISVANHPINRSPCAMVVA